MDIKYNPVTNKLELTGWLADFNVQDYVALEYVSDDDLLDGHAADDYDLITQIGFENDREYIINQDELTDAIREEIRNVIKARIASHQTAD